MFLQGMTVRGSTGLLTNNSNIKELQTTTNICNINQLLYRVRNGSTCKQHTLQLPEVLLVSRSSRPDAHKVLLLGPEMKLLSLMQKHLHCRGGKRTFIGVDQFTEN